MLILWLDVIVLPGLGLEYLCMDTGIVNPQYYMLYVNVTFPEIT